MHFGCIVNGFYKSVKLVFCTFAFFCKGAIFVRRGRCALKSIAKYFP